MIHIRIHMGPLLVSGGLLGASWGSLGPPGSAASWGFLGLFGSWGFLGLLGVFLELLGVSWSLLGSLGLLWGFLWFLWELLGFIGFSGGLLAPPGIFLGCPGGSWCFCVGFFGFSGASSGFLKLFDVSWGILGCLLEFPGAFWGFLVPLRVF